MNLINSVIARLLKMPTKLHINFYEHKHYKNNEAEIGKKKSTLRIFFEAGNFQHRKLNIFLLKIYFSKSDLSYTYYINLVKTIIRYQKLRLTCRESPSS